MRLLTLTAARKLLWQSQREGLQWTWAQGYHWITEQFVPAIERVAGNTEQWSDQWTAARSYYVLGDVWHLNGAPKAAISEYRKCLALDPDEWAAWREIGCMYEEMGEYRRGRIALKRGLKIDPEGDFLESDLRSLEESAQQNRPANFQPKDVFWRCQELFAKGNAKRALEILRRKRSLNASLARAQAYGVLGDAALFLRQWEKIGKRKERFTLTGYDWFWFFMPDDAWWEPRFWEILIDAYPLRLHGYRGRWLVHQSLWRLFSETKRTRPHSKAGRNRTKQQRLLTLRYHLARSLRDQQRLQKLADRYPDWEEVRETMELLHKNDRFTLNPYQKGLVIP